MSSAIATCSPGHEAGALDRRDQRRERLLVAREVGPPAAFVGDAEERAARGHQLAGVAVDLGRPFERLGEAARAPGRRP